MDVLNGILDALGIDAITNAVKGVTGIIDKLTLLINGPEVSFLDKMEGFFGNMTDVFDKLGGLSFDFDQFQVVIDAVGKLFGA